MKVLYVPIDERPCNTLVVKRIAQTAHNIELLTPPNECYGDKKTPADAEMMWTWINKHAEDCDALILSLDMIIYGGLLPSRIHYLNEEDALKWINRLRELREKNPKLPIYASNLIMRTPRYSSSDEEPDYYEDWGREIFLQAYLEDKNRQNKLSDEEQSELNAIKNVLPEHFVRDYEVRRKFNLQVNHYILELVLEGVISLLVIPQDDSSEYGYTAMDQREIHHKLEELRLVNDVLIYPGADEVGATLLSRVYNDVKGHRPKVYPIWSSPMGPNLIPLYEDRPFAASMKEHIYAAGCRLTETPDDADLILAYNVPGKVMQESWEQSKKDITYSSFRNMTVFVDQIKGFIEQGKDVVIADSAYANGGDKELITLMDEEQILEKVLSYKGWNTNCNTLGTTISQGVIGHNGDLHKIQENIVYHLLDDFFYQAEVRMTMTSDYLPTFNLNYFNLNDKEQMVNQERDKLLIALFQEHIRHSFRNMKFLRMETYAPWNRMFECGINLKTSFS